jgi:hypothetical protein
MKEEAEVEELSVTPLKQYTQIIYLVLQKASGK